MSSNVIDLTNAKVLMVDDTPANIDVLRKVLSVEGYKLSFATSGEKALKIAPRALPDLIMLDVMMPGMDGFETCQHLKADERTEDIPVIFITAKTDVADLVEGFKVGAVDYITKPFKQEEVKVRVRTHLQTRVLFHQRESLIGTLRANEERFRLLATWSPIGIFQTNPKGELTYTNEKWQTIFGLDMKKAMLDSWLDSIFVDDKPKIETIWRQCVLTQQSFTSKFRVSTPAGELRWVQARATPLFNSDRRDDITGFVGTIEDITELKLSEERILHAKESAEQAAKAKADFLSGMTHELRTPLNAIIGYTEMLSEDMADEEDLQDLDKITSASKYLLNLINNVLDLAKVDANKMTLCLEELEVAPLIDEVTAMITPLVNKNSNQLNVKNDEDIFMYTDSMKVKQILYNLLSNACKFTKNGSIDLRVEQDNSQWIIFTVNDSGIGMTEQQKTKLFQKYVQADNSIMKTYGGTGLGLVLSRQFCQMMGGDISIESKENVGSTFTVKLPIICIESAEVVD